jgi:hypothetical protein
MVVAVRPPADAAQTFRVQAVEGVLQCLKTGQGLAFGAFFLQCVAQVRGGLGDGGLDGIERGHGGKGGRRRLTIGLGRAPTSRAITLGCQQIVQGIEGKQLANPGTLAGNQVQFVAVVLADHPQAAGQRQDKQQKQQLKFTCEAKTPQQPDPR